MTGIKICYNNEEYTIEELVQKLSSSEEKIKELQSKVNAYAMADAISIAHKKYEEDCIRKLIKENLNKCCYDSKAEQDASITLGMIVALTELGKNNEKIKELNAENFKLKEENATLKKEKELLKKNLELTEEIRNNSSEKRIIELQEDKRSLQYKIQDLEYDLTKQTQLNVYLVQLLKEKEE